jgi:hypothetical protein
MNNMRTATKPVNPRAHIELRQRVFQPGMRVRAVHFSTQHSSVNDNESVPPGTIGQVGYVDGAGTVHVNWENGSRLGVLVEDRLEIISD